VYRPLSTEQRADVADSVHASTVSRVRNLYLAVNLRRVAFSDTSVGGEDVEEEILSLFKRREFTRDEPVSPYTINCGGSTVSPSLAERVAGRSTAPEPSELCRREPQTCSVQRITPVLSNARQPTRIFRRSDAGDWPAAGCRILRRAPSPNPEPIATTSEALSSDAPPSPNIGSFAVYATESTAVATAASPVATSRASRAAARAPPCSHRSP